MLDIPRALILRRSTSLKQGQRHWLQQIGTGKAADTIATRLSRFADSRIGGD